MKQKCTLAPPGVDVVVVDDEESIREGCRLVLEGEGYKAEVASSGTEALELFARCKPRIAVLDLRMPGMGGLELLQRIPAIDPRIVPIVVTGYASVDTAVDSMKHGAFEFITKPFEPADLVRIVERGMHKWAAFAPPPPVRAPAPVHRERSEADAVLKGLEALAEFHEVGERHHTLAEELRSLEKEADYHARQLGSIQQKEKLLREFLNDLRLVDAIIARHEYKRNALIQVLLDVQAEKNWLPRHVLGWISRRLDVPMGRILEVATFYEAFSLEPQGKHTVQVCMGTACHVRKAPELSAKISALLGIQPGETDPELNFTFKEVHCLGCCALAPVVKVDEAYYGDPSLKQLKKIFEDCKSAEQTEGAE